MQFNLTEIPFSIKGSYMAVSYFPEKFRGKKTLPGLYLRNIHGSAGRNFVARIIPLYKGEEADYEYKAEPSLVEITVKDQSLYMTFAEEATILIKGKGKDIGFRMDFKSEEGMFDFIQPYRFRNTTRYLENSFITNSRYMISIPKGEEKLEQEWDVSSAKYSSMKFTACQGELLAAVEEVADSWAERAEDYDFDECCKKTGKDFHRFYQSMPSVPPEFETVRETAAYINWSSFVTKSGFFKRDAMLMSKNWMCNVWSWDHCFNALALAYNNPEEAWNQFMIMFDYQSPSGRIPDSINDSKIINNFCKPPIHGWTFRKLSGIMKITKEQAEEAYEKLSKWTNWWLNYRDQDESGLCEYTHGNDSGWDNSTAFRYLPPAKTPDLAAFLSNQMEVLSELAEHLCRLTEAKDWRKKSDEMLHKMCAAFYAGEQPQVIQCYTKKTYMTDSLLVYLPVILGKRLPAELRNKMIEVLKGEKFCTQYGLATESVSSSYYEPDGYWRGPIWAPSTMLILDGLKECGEVDFVKEMTRRFCLLVQKSGCAENFDALTGEGLRDRAYTWTASVMLVMAHEYL